MKYSYLFGKNAVKDIQSLDTLIQKRIKKKLEYLAEVDDILVYAKHLTDSETGEYRLRVGNYRVLFDIEGAVLIILRVRHRRESYKK